MPVRLNTHLAVTLTAFKKEANPPGERDFHLQELICGLMDFLLDLGLPLIQLLHYQLVVLISCLLGKRPCCFLLLADQLHQFVVELDANLRFVEPELRVNYFAWK